MNFVDVFDSIVKDAERLQHEGLLEPLLGIWAKFEDEQRAIIENRLDSCEAPVRSALKAAGIRY